nr:hypothetical protein [Halomarina oriensis]
MGEAVDSLADEYGPGRCSVRLDWAAFSDFDRGLAEQLREDPRQQRVLAEQALVNLRPDLERQRRHAGRHARLNVRIRNLPTEHTYRVGKQRTRHLGHLIALTGTVIETEGVVPFASEAAWECQRCGTMTRMKQSAGKMIEPSICGACENQGPFVFNERESDLVDFQEVVLIPQDTELDSPPAVTVFAKDDLCDRMGVDDRVTVVGVFDTLPKQNETKLKTYVEAFDLDVDEYQEVGADSAELSDRIVAFVEEHMDEGSDWGVHRETVVTEFRKKGLREEEVRDTIETLSRESRVDAVSSKLVVMG